jgi:hypothetical protein
MEGGNNTSTIKITITATTILHNNNNNNKSNKNNNISNNNIKYLVYIITISHATRTVVIFF